ncbi:MAG: hypothetical protein ABIG42_05800, partial [bacterium]
MMDTDYMVRSIIQVVIFIVFPFLLTYFGLKKYLSISQKQNIDRAVREETGERHIAKRKIPDMAGIVLITVFALYIVILPAIPRLNDY